MLHASDVPSEIGPILRDRSLAALWRCERFPGRAEFFARDTSSALLRLETDDAREDLAQVDSAGFFEGQSQRLGRHRLTGGGQEIRVVHTSQFSSAWFAFRFGSGLSGPPEGGHDVHKPLRAYVVSGFSRRFDVNASGELRR